MGKRRLSLWVELLRTTAYLQHMLEKNMYLGLGMYNPAEEL
jgi:hypothetical protein